MHFTMALTVATIFYALSRRLPLPKKLAGVVEGGFANAALGLMDIVKKAAIENLAEAFAAAMDPKTVGLIVAEEITAADLMGPAEVFSRATIRKSDQPEARESRCYRVMTIGINAGPCVTECGIVIRPHLHLEEAPPLDTVFVCSGSGGNGEKLNRKLVKRAGEHDQYSEACIC